MGGPAAGPLQNPRAAGAGGIADAGAKLVDLLEGEVSALSAPQHPRETGAHEISPAATLMAKAGWHPEGKSLLVPIRWWIAGDLEHLTNQNNYLS